MDTKRLDEIFELINKVETCLGVMSDVRIKSIAAENNLSTACYGLKCAVRELKGLNEERKD